MKSIFVLIVIFGLCQSKVAAQNTLRAYKLDSLVRVNGEEKTIRFLLNLSSFKDTISVSKAWYSDIFAEDELKMEKIRLFPFMESERIKICYWIWLVYEDKISLSENIAVLISNCSEKKLFDYKIIDKNALWLKKVSDPWVKELEDGYEGWAALVELKGLAYVRKKKISPLNGAFRFKVFESNHLDKFRR